MGTFRVPVTRLVGNNPAQAAVDVSAPNGGATYNTDISLWPIGAICTHNEHWERNVRLNDPITSTGAAAYTLTNIPYVGMVLIAPVTYFFSLRASQTDPGALLSDMLAWEVQVLGDVISPSFPAFNTTGGSLNLVPTGAPVPSLRHFIGPAPGYSRFTRLNNHVHGITRASLALASSGSTGASITGFTGLWSETLVWSGDSGCPGTQITLSDGAAGLNAISTFYFNYIDGDDELVTVPATIVTRTSSQVVVEVPELPAGEFFITATFDSIVEPSYTEVYLGGFEVPEGCPTTVTVPPGDGGIVIGGTSPPPSRVVNASPVSGGIRVAGSSVVQRTLHFPSTDPGGVALSGPPVDGSGFFDCTCCAETQLAITNDALLRIGISIAVEDIYANTRDAVVARSQYPLARESTLRDFPWPFATTYAELVLVEGSSNAPVNPDWTFSYRKPEDSVFERRLVTPRAGAVNPTPPPFRLGHDGADALIFSNEEDAVLEYTTSFPAVVCLSDALFREAFAWRLAHAIAPALTRTDDKTAHCWSRYQETLEGARLVFELGAPGHRPTADPYAADAACPLDTLRVVNLALTRIGGRTIAALEEQSRESGVMAIVYEQELRATLRDFAWPFATEYAALTLVHGSETAPANAGWTYAYRLPASCLYARRIARPLASGGPGRTFDPAPAAFRIGRDAGGLLLFTNEADATLEYTVRVPCAPSVGDALFVDAFAWRLAYAAAPSIATPDPDTAEQIDRVIGLAGYRTPKRRTEAAGLQLQQMRLARAAHALRMYQFTVAQAKAAGGNEQQKELGARDAEWIRER